MFSFESLPFDAWTWFLRAFIVIMIAFMVVGIVNLMADPEEEEEKEDPEIDLGFKYT